MSDRGFLLIDELSIVTVVGRLEVEMRIGQLFDVDDSSLVHVRSKSGESLGSFVREEFLEYWADGANQIIGLVHDESYIQKVIEQDAEMHLVGWDPPREGNDSEIDMVLAIGQPGQKVVFRTEDLPAFDVSVTIGRSGEEPEMEAFTPKELIAEVKQFSVFVVEESRVRTGNGAYQVIDAKDGDLVVREVDFAQNDMLFYKCPVPFSNLSSDGRLLVLARQAKSFFFGFKCSAKSTEVLFEDEDTAPDDVLILLAEDDEVLLFTTLEQEETHCLKLTCKKLHGVWEILPEVFCPESD